MSKDVEYLAANWRDWAVSVWETMPSDKRTLERLYRYAMRIFGRASEPAIAVAEALYCRAIARGMKRAEQRERRYKSLYAVSDN